jgi:hypothetical protein
MQITLIKHRDGVEIISNQDDLPLDVPIVLYTSDEIAKRMGYRPEELLQLQSIAAEEEDDWGAELDVLAGK